MGKAWRAATVISRSRWLVKYASVPTTSAPGALLDQYGSGFRYTRLVLNLSRRQTYRSGLTGILRFRGRA